MKLSVVMLAYNHERFIGNALESVMAQRVNFEYEVLIGEDCSTDGTRGIIIDFAQRHPGQIKLLPRDRNLGVIRNFVQTIEACKGEYVAFLEGDDYWVSAEKIQKQVDFLDSHPDCAMCCSRARIVYENARGDLGSQLEVIPNCPAGSYSIKEILKGDIVITCSVALRRSLVPPFPRWFFEMKMGDWPLWAMVARAGTIELMDEVTAAYRVHPGGCWSSLTRAAQISESVRMLSALDRELNFKYSRTIAETVAPFHFSLAVESRSNGRRIEAAKQTISYIRNGGWRLPGSARAILGMITYTVIGSWYKIFSRAKAT